MLIRVLKVSAVVVGLLLIAHCAQDKMAKRGLSENPRYNPKISAALGHVISKLSANRKSEAQALQATENARVDDRGNIQCYVHCKRIDEQTRSLVKQKSAKMELVEKNSSIIQGWFSPQNILWLAELDNIVSITLPEYGEPHR
jgi:hypothetical protein